MFELYVFNYYKKLNTNERILLPGKPSRKSGPFDSNDHIKPVSQIIQEPEISESPRSVEQLIATNSTESNCKSNPDSHSQP